MKSAIEEIYLNDSGYYEAIKPNEKYWELHKKSEELLKELTESIGEDEMVKLTELTELIAEMDAEQNLTHFKEGYKLGMLTAIEVLK